MSEQFCTYFDHRYAAKGLAMWKSLKQHCKTAALHVLCLNDACREILADLHLDDVHLHSLSALEAADPELFRTRGNRSLVEYYFTLTPCLLLYILKTHSDMARLTYVDADLYFFANPKPVLDEVRDNAVGIIEHRFPDDLADRQVYGRFNVGWLTFSRNPIAVECLETWREQCIAWCYDRLESGRFAEQKYLDEWPDRFQRVRIVQHRGANVAPWNLNRFKISLNRDKVRVGGQPLIFYHAHGFEPESPGRPRRLNLKEYNVEESPLLIESVFMPYERALISATKKIAVPLALALASDRSRETIFLLETLKSRVSHLDSQLSANEADRTAKVDAISTLQEQLSESQADRAAKADANYALLAQLAASEGDRAAKADALLTLHAQLTKSDADRAMKAETIQTLQTQLAETDADRIAKVDAINTLQEQLSESQADRAAKANALLALQTRLTESDADRIAKADAINTLQEQLSKSQADCAAKTTAIQTLQRQLTESEADRIARGTAIKSLQTQITSTEATLAEVRNYLGQTQAHLAALQGSLSWKWTHLFRVVWDSASNVKSASIRLRRVAPPRGVELPEHIEAVTAPRELPESQGSTEAPPSRREKSEMSKALRIALIGHSYHRKTKSNGFFIELLQRLGSVEIHFSESWQGKGDAWATQFEPDSYDCIVIWQAYEAFQYLRCQHPNVLFVPMYDAMMHGSSFFWKEAFDAAKVLCFSSELHRHVVGHTTRTRYVQYAPDPAVYPTVNDCSGLRAFFWQRIPLIGANLIAHLCQQTQFEKFTVHAVPDPSTPAPAMNWTAIMSSALETTTWFSNFEEYLRIVADHTVFFAPRHLEGIGMSFLEAMAMGLCVVAPNTATHNEYISHGTTGLLYNLNNPPILDLGRAREIGLRARDSILRARERWVSQQDSVLEFISTPTMKAACSRRLFCMPIPTPPESIPGPCSRSTPKHPKVSVVTVCLNAVQELPATIASVLSQDYPEFEYVILDGGSSDGTQEIIRQYASRLHYWRSRPDDGAYGAMYEALAFTTAEWVIFMNAGDHFVTPNALSRLFAQVPDGTDVVFGHHIYRTVDDIDEIHPAAEFDVTWDRLQQGQLDFDWLSGIPGHQSTAVRTQLLRRMGFDRTLRIAADHDFLFRAKQSGARFFNADELISVYLGGGMSARNGKLCHREWEEIAVRYGDSSAARAFYARLRATETHSRVVHHVARCNHLLNRLAGTALGRTVAKVPGASRTMAVVRQMASSLVNTAAAWSSARQSGPASQFQPEEPRYEAALADGIAFSRIGWPTFVEKVSGVSHPEDWGCWSTGRRVRVVLAHNLPLRFTLLIEGYAFGKNTEKPIVVKAGSVKRRLRMASAPSRRYRVEFETMASSRIIEFQIPYPTSPAALYPGQTEDTRLLGLALNHLGFEFPEPKTSRAPSSSVAPQPNG